MADQDEGPKRLSKAAQELREEETTDTRFAALADAITALASGVAQKAKAGGLKAKDVLDLAQAVKLAQQIRGEAQARRRQRRMRRKAKREGLVD